MEVREGSVRLRGKREGEGRMNIGDLNFQAVIFFTARCHLWLFLVLLYQQWDLDLMFLVKMSIS